MSEEEKLDMILKQCENRFDQFTPRTELEAFWAKVCFDVTGNRDANNLKFKAYLQHLIDDGYVEFSTQDSMYKATIKGKRFGGYVKEKKKRCKEKGWRIATQIIAILAFIFSVINMWLALRKEGIIPKGQTINISNSDSLKKK